MTDEKWELVAPVVASKGRPLDVDRRRVVDAIFGVTATIVGGSE